MAHFPVNHPHRGMFRALAFLTGAAILLFGLIGLLSPSSSAFGIHAGMGLSIGAIALGAVVVVTTFLSDAAHLALMSAGGLLWTIGLLMLALLHTNLNVLNFQVATCVVSFLAGTMLVLAGMYTKLGSQEQELAQEAFRHSGRGVVFPAVEHPEFSLHPQVTHRGDAAE